MAGKFSFRDPVTNVLKAWGYTPVNSPGDLVRPEEDTFALEPGKWQWNGAAWVAFTPPAPPPSALVQSLDTLLTVPTPTIPQIIAVLRVWRQGLST